MIKCWGAPISCQGNRWVFRCAVEVTRQNKSNCETAESRLVSLSVSVDCIELLFLIKSFSFLTLHWCWRVKQRFVCNVYKTNWWEETHLGNAIISKSGYISKQEGNVVIFWAQHYDKSGNTSSTTTITNDIRRVSAMSAQKACLKRESSASYTVHYLIYKFKMP